MLTYEAGGITRCLITLYIGSTFRTYLYVGLISRFDAHATERVVRENWKRGRTERNPPIAESSKDEYFLAFRHFRRCSVPYCTI
jgi:hypothetical protein